LARPVVAFLSDFGTRDHYAGTLKAVVLSVCPDATLVDIGHEIPAHDVVAGALELAACYRFFPAGTIFLVVVDPGVGSSRRGIAADCGDYRFVAPDNGVLSAVFRETPPRKVIELTERKYARATVSRTFEGRDRFAPAAGWLAKGIALVSMGKSISNYQIIDLPRPEVASDQIAGEVMRVDRFGNLITNIDRRTLEQFAAGHSIRITIGDREIARIVATYAEAPAGELCALFGSTDHLEIAVNAGDAARELGLSRGAKATVRLV
jgi:S-adenosylmethionine hydrolase